MGKIPQDPCSMGIFAIHYNYNKNNNKTDNNNNKKKLTPYNNNYLYIIKNILWYIKRIT